MMKSTIGRVRRNTGYETIRCSNLYISSNSSTLAMFSTSTSRRRPRIRQPFLSQNDPFVPQQHSWYQSPHISLPVNIDTSHRQRRLLSSSTLSFADFTRESQVINHEELSNDVGITPMSTTEIPRIHTFNSLSTINGCAETAQINGTETSNITTVSSMNFTNRSFDDSSSCNGQTELPRASDQIDAVPDINIESASIEVTSMPIPNQQSSVELGKIDFNDVAVASISGNETDSLQEIHQQQHHHPDDDVAIFDVSTFSQPEAPVESEQGSGDISKFVQPPVKHPLISRFMKCIRDENIQASIRTFKIIMAKNDQKGAPTIEIQPGLTKAYIYLMNRKHPFEVFNAVQYYVSLKSSHEKNILGGDISVYKKYYRLICDSIRFINPRTHSAREARQLISSVISHVGNLDRAGQEMCVPVLLSALCEQPMVNIGHYFAGKVYRHLMEQNFTVPDGYWLHLLSYSAFNRQDIPYDDILSRIVDLGFRPDQLVVLNVLENFFPFTNVHAVSKLLKALLTLQKQVAADIKAGKADVAKQYFVDIHLLETIGAAAASQGQSEICLLVWDMLDVLEYQTSEGVYENTVVAFAMNTFTYREAFIVLYEMEVRGFHPSRALIRSISIHLRDSVKNMDFAQIQVSELRQKNTIQITTSIMNVLMSGAAERGDVDRLLSVLKDFDRFGIAFNADSISFGFESLGKNLLRRKNFNSTYNDQPRTRDHIDACMVVANVLLNHMDDHRVKTTDHIIRNYVEFLCITGHIDTATSILLEAMNEKGLVSSKSIYRVAISNAKSFRFDVARQIAEYDHSPFLLDAIEREEKLFNASLTEQHERDATAKDFDPLPKENISDKPQEPDSSSRGNISTSTPTFWKPQTKTV